jgi:hypothetical protein
MESNHPSVGLPRPAGFEDLVGPRSQPRGFEPDDADLTHIASETRPSDSGDISAGSRRQQKAMLLLSRESGSEGSEPRYSCFSSEADASHPVEGDVVHPT